MSRGPPRRTPRFTGKPVYPQFAGQNTPYFTLAHVEAHPDETFHCCGSGKWARGLPRGLDPSKLITVRGPGAEKWRAKKLRDREREENMAVAKVKKLAKIAKGDPPPKRKRRIIEQPRNSTSVTAAKTKKSSQRQKQDTSTFSSLSMKTPTRTKSNTAAPSSFTGRSQSTFSWLSATSQKPAVAPTSPIKPTTTRASSSRSSSFSNAPEPPRKSVADKVSNNSASSKLSTSSRSFDTDIKRTVMERKDENCSPTIPRVNKNIITVNQSSTGVRMYTAREMSALIFKNRELEAQIKDLRGKLREEVQARRKAEKETEELRAAEAGGEKAMEL